MPSNEAKRTEAIVKTNSIMSKINEANADCLLFEEAMFSQENRPDLIPILTDIKDKVQTYFDELKELQVQYTLAGGDQVLVELEAPAPIMKTAKIIKKNILQFIAATTVQEKVTFKPLAALKPAKLCITDTVAQMRDWVKEYLTYFEASKIGIQPSATQQSCLMACLDPVLAAKISQVDGLPTIGTGQCYLNIVREAFKSAQPLYKRRIELATFKQQTAKCADFCQKVEQMVLDADIENLTAREFMVSLLIANLGVNDFRAQLLEKDNLTINDCYRHAVNYDTGHPTQTLDVAPTSTYGSSDTAATWTPNPNPSGPRKAQNRNPTGNSYNKEPARRNPPANRNSQPPYCSTCNQRGHYPANCPEQLCIGCKKKGHSVGKCPRNKPQQANATVTEDDGFVNSICASDTSAASNI